MAIYEFECGPCALKWEVISSIAVPVEPPTCHICKREMRRLISKSSFFLKGRGWAKDGYQK
jgi:putative FmdB family regulatory protein